MIMPIQPNEASQSATYTRKDASLYLASQWSLSCSPHTLARYASMGVGPEYRKAGICAIYTREALDAWAQTRVTQIARRASEIKSFPAASKPAGQSQITENKSHEI